MELITGIASLCFLAGAAYFFMAGSWVAGAVSGFGSIISACCCYSCYSSRCAKRKQADQEEEEAKTTFNAQNDQFEKITKLHQKLSVAAKDLDEEHLGNVCEVIKHAVRSLGLEAKNYLEHAEAPLLLPYLFSESLGSDLKNFISKNSQLLDDVRQLEAGVLNVCAKLTESCDLPTVLPAFQPNIEGWMESPTELPSEPSTPLSSPSSWDILKDDDLSSCSSRSSQGNGLSPR